MLAVVHDLLQDISPRPGCYLVSCFSLDTKWKVDFYDPGEHVLYTYERTDGRVVETKDVPFQKEQAVLQPLDLSAVTVDYAQAVALSEISGKHVLAVLRVQDGRTLWQMSCVTESLEIETVLVDAVSGELVSRKKESLFHLRS